MGQQADVLTAAHAPRNFGTTLVAPGIVMLALAFAFAPLALTMFPVDELITGLVIKIF